MSRQLRNITFVTGNEGKIREVRAILSQYEIIRQNIDLPELQGEPKDIVREKLRLASQYVDGPVLVEDTSLCFNALGGLPGPYIKWFLQKIGHQGLNNLLAAYEDKSAYAQCLFGLRLPGQEPLVFEGQCPGSIVAARGSTAFGWDAVFEPDGLSTTFGEMTKEKKNAISHRSRALSALKAYFDTL